MTIIPGARFHWRICRSKNKKSLIIVLRVMRSVFFPETVSASSSSPIEFGPIPPSPCGLCFNRRRGASFQLVGPAVDIIFLTQGANFVVGVTQRKNSLRPLAFLRLCVEFSFAMMRLRPIVFVLRRRRLLFFSLPTPPSIRLRLSRQIRPLNFSERNLQTNTANERASP